LTAFVIADNKFYIAALRPQSFIRYNIFRREQDNCCNCGQRYWADAMEKIERIGVSVEAKLLSAFDELTRRQGYQSRSEAIRDLIRARLSQQRLADPKAKAVAAVMIVYEHHSTRVIEKLTALQHSHLLHTISTMHIHLDDHHCLELIVLRGRVGEINRMAEQIISIKGIKLGRTNIVAVDAV